VTIVAPPLGGSLFGVGRAFPFLAGAVSPVFSLATLLAIPLGGVAGATADSVLGATVQELRRCDVCDRACETDPHACGAPSRLVRGVRGFSNDVVNLLATATGAAVAFGFATAFAR